MSNVDRLAGTLTERTVNKETVKLRRAEIRGVSVDETNEVRCDIRLDGSASTLTGIDVLGSYRPQINDVVTVLRSGPNTLVLGRTGEQTAPAGLLPPPIVSFAQWCLPGWGGVRDRSVQMPSAAVGRYQFAYIRVDEDINTSEMGVYIPSGGSGSSDASVNIGIYTLDALGAPDKVIATTGPLDCSTTGEKSNTVAASLKRGWYAVAFVANESLRYRTFAADKISTMPTTGLGDSLLSSFNLASFCSVDGFDADASGSLRDGPFGDFAPFCSGVGPGSPVALRLVPIVP